ncbi:MAG: AMP-binding protein, partial [Alphaproteobacteria bacterium]
IPSPTNNDETEQLKHVILVDGQSNTVPNKQDKRILSWDSLKNTASEQFADKITSAEDPATIIYTSGTTGSPKGALHAHRVLLGHLPGVQLPQNLFPQDGDLFWTPADWAWIGGLLDVLLPSLYFGVPVLAKRFSKFTPEQAFDLIKKHKVQNLFLPPTVLKMMMQAGTDEILQVRSIGSGGETLGTHIQDWSKRTFGVPVNEFYGQTECNLIVSNCHCLFPIKSGSMGKPMIGFDVELIDLEGNIVPCGEIGQVAVKRPNPTLMLEYWRNPEATAAKFLDNWMLTGDLAKRDEDGHLWYVSRDDDLITSAGYRIGPGEIEDCLLSHPHISLAAVVGVPDETRTEVVTAFVVTTNDVSAQDIQTWVKSRVGQHSYPRYVFFVDELPTTATGKIIRAELRKLGSTLVN